ncbi:hypothetical protein [Ectobacillus antri]|uniref:hypothetical protein n=1 Tax=Ectobacillus antri TaxID=2486280 RepID=UPI000F5B2966|nr:hypothetical protein [Ectobacillus antri]
MFTLKRLSNCHLDEVVEAWNLGFQGYFVNMETTTEKFLKRFVSEGLSPDLSIVVFNGNKPVGLLLNGIRELGGLERRHSHSSPLSTKRNRKDADK